MSDVIWVSDALSDSNLVYQFEPSENWYRDNMEQAGQALAIYSRAELLPPELQYPATAYLKRLTTKNRQIDPLHHIFTTDFMLVSQTVRDIMEQFDLGQTAFLKVDLYRHDQKTRFEPDYYYLNIAEKKDAMVPKQSKDLGGYSFRLSKSSVVAVERRALEGVDLWMEPKYVGAVFFSDRLYQALKSAGCIDHMRFDRCKLVD